LKCLQSGILPKLECVAHVLWVIGVDIKAIGVVIEFKIGGVKNTITASSVSENGGAFVVQEDFELAGPVCEDSKLISIGGIKSQKSLAVRADPKNTIHKISKLPRNELEIFFRSHFHYFKLASFRIAD
jgi:hypothetical protein